MIAPGLASAPPPAALRAGAIAELRGPVRRFIAARVKNAALADDLTQDVFVKVLRQLPRVRDPRRIMGWILQIARRAVADHFRRGRRDEPFDENHAGAITVESDAIDRGEARLREELATYIQAVVNELPPPYREALLLTEMDGLSQVELAHRIGLSVSAAKSRVQRARAMVRATIDRCCHFEVDHYGRVVAYQPRQGDCGTTTRHSRERTAAIAAGRPAACVACGGP
jgi:RNA polymerase sigma-70 factor, ECF subfamily